MGPFWKDFSHNDTLSYFSGTTSFMFSVYLFCTLFVFDMSQFSKYMFSICIEKSDKFAFLLTGVITWDNFCVEVFIY